MTTPSVDGKLVAELRAYCSAICQRRCARSRGADRLVELLVESARLTNAIEVAHFEVRSMRNRAETAEAALAAIALHFIAQTRDKVLEEAIAICREPELKCCGNEIHGGFDHPPECCGQFEPRPKTLDEAIDAIRAAKGSR